MGQGRSDLNLGGTEGVTGDVDAVGEGRGYDVWDCLETLEWTNIVDLFAAGVGA